MIMDENEQLAEPRRRETVAWPVWAADRKPLFPERNNQLFAKFAAWMDKHAKDIWTGKSGLELSTEEHQKLRGGLLNTARNSGERRILAHWWDTLIATGNRASIWKIPFLASETILPRIAPAFVHRDFQLLQQYRTIEDGLIRLICRGLEVGQLKDAALCSAVFFGGIASADRLAALCKLTSEDLDGHQMLMWAMLQIPQGKKSMRAVRWYPDSLTGALMTRSRETEIWSGRLGDAVGVTGLINALCRLGFAIPRNDRFGNDLLRAVQVALSLDHMGVVAAYLSDRFVSHSLPDSILHRIARWKISGEADKAPGSDFQTISAGEEIHVRAPEFKPGVNSSSQHKITTRVSAILRQGKQAYANLDLLQKEQGEEMWPVTFYLVEWAKWRIKPGTGAQGIRPISVLRYFQPLVRAFVYEAESEDLFSLDVEDFETLYELTTANVRGDEERSRVWITLRSFHDFLFLGGAPDINFRELDGYTSEHSPGNVSANLITEAEFGQFKTIFFNEGQDNNSSAHRRVFFAAMLGFRAGLRRREVQMLRMCDYHPGPEPYLLVRPSKFATLKSNSSNRRIPLKALLPSDELTAFVAYMEQRHAVWGSQTQFAFADLHAPDTPPSQARLIDPVTEAFQHICGKGRSNFCFHHLRHSFSNWLFLSLLSSDQPELLNERAHFLDSDLLQGKHIQTIRDSLFPRLAGTPASPDRRHLYQVAAFMGHLSPITTLQNYLHLLDWIAMRSLDIALDVKFADLKLPSLGKICGLSPSAPYKRPYSDLAGNPTRFFREFIRVHGELAKEHVQARVGLDKDLLNVVESLNTSTPPDIRLVIKLVARRMGQNDSFSLAKTFAVNSQAIDEAHNAYLRMYAKQSVLHPKEILPRPAVPRTMRDRIDFWQVIEATERAYRKKENRKFLSLAAECLIRRNGPRTGNLYFGKRVNDAPDIARGILLMGIAPAQAKLVLRQVSADSHLDKTTESTVNEIRKSGIEVVPEQLDWTVRNKKSDLMRLEVDVYNAHTNGSRVRSEGRVRGLNYAAMWILLAKSMEEHRHVTGGDCQSAHCVLHPKPATYNDLTLATQNDSKTAT